MAVRIRRSVRELMAAKMRPGGWRRGEAGKRCLGDYTGRTW